MTRQVVSTTPHSSGLGNKAFESFEKINANEAELYAAFGVTGASALSASTYAAARSLFGATTGDRLQVLGRTSQNDGGQGLFTWVAGGTTTVDDGYVLQAVGGTWNRADPSPLGGGRVVNLRQFGVTPSASAASNTTAINKAIAAVGEHGAVIVPNFGSSPINYNPITLPFPVALVGEAPLTIAAGLNLASYLNCVSTTDPGISLDPTNSGGLTITGICLGGGSYALDLASLDTSSVRVSACTFLNTQKACVHFAGHVEHIVFDNNFLNPFNATTCGIICDSVGYNFVNQGSQIDDATFFNNWIYGVFKIGLFCQQEPTGTSQGWQGVRIQKMRITGSRLCSMALRTSMQSCTIDDWGDEQSNQNVASPNKVSILIDCNQYGGGPSFSALNLVMTNMACSNNPPNFPVLARGAEVLWRGNTGLAGAGGSVGVTYLEDHNIDSSGAQPIGVDPGTGVIGPLTASAQPVFNY